MKILVIEDNEMVLKSIEFRLKKDNHEVITALDGKKAMEIIKKEKPDMIITDIMMPYVSGLEIISYVRKEVPARIPIIVLSAVGHEKTVLEAFEFGADDFITKPFSPNELSVRVKRLATSKTNN